LGFAVAAFLEPEILIVDEVLAVGDAEFQKKAIGKMQDVSQSEGRTILFVSHNMNAVKHLCKTGILLKNGQIAFQGTAEETVEKYLEVNFDDKEQVNEIRVQPKGEKSAQILYAAVKNAKGEVCGSFDINDDIFIEIEYEIREKRGGLAIAIDVFRKETDLFRSFDSDNNPERLEQREKGKYKTSVKMPQLKAGTYFTEIHIGLLKVEMIDLVKTLNFTILENSIDTTFKSFSENRPGEMRTELDWIVEKIS
jgi:lipopolysaccharide transport system ATP-binding protein